MQQHVAVAGHLALTVDDMVVKIAVNQKQSGDDQKCHQRIVEAAERVLTAEVTGNADDHLAEGEHHKEHDALGQVGKIQRDKVTFAAVEQLHEHAEHHRQRRQRQSRQRKHRQRGKHDTCLDQHHGYAVPQMRSVPGRELFHLPELDEVLHRKINEDQPPCDVVLEIKVLPADARAVRHVVEQIHIDENAHILRHRFGAVAVDKERRQIPDMQRNQGRQQVGEIDVKGNKPALHGVDKRVISADDIDEDQVVDQLDIFDLLFFLFQKIKNHKRRLSVARSVRTLRMWLRWPWSKAQRPQAADPVRRRQRGHRFRRW